MRAASRGGRVVRSGRRTLTLEIDHHLGECVGLDYRLCMLVREPGETDFTFHYDGIRGFEYEWGRRYRVVVTERDITPVADGSSIERTLDRVVSEEEAAGEEFELTLTDPRARVEVVVAGTTWRFYGAREMTCAQPLECGTLATLLDSDTRLRLHLEHPPEPSDPLIVHGWEDAGPPGGPG